MAYIFDPQRLHAIAGAAIDQVEADAPMDALLDRLTQGLAAAYPGHIDDGPREWIYNTAGGSMGQMAILQASLNEYVLFFGTPLATGGHSGRYRVDLWDIVLRGEMLTWVAGQMEPTVHGAGAMNCLHKGNAHGYRMSDGGWALEYGRGPIASALPFALADTMFSTLDFRTFGQTMRRYTQLTMKSLLRRRRPH